MINSFRGKYAFLSNFQVAPMRLNGEAWRTVEHFFQAMKTQDLAEQKWVRQADSPGFAKSRGRRVRMRPDWEGVKVSVMRKALTAKFTQHAWLGKKLIETQPLKLIEGNYWHDNFWGDCSCPKCRKFSGKNVLGLLLMEVRASLNSQPPVDPPF